VKSSALLFFLFIPVGAGIDVDEKELEKAERKNSSRVLAAGVGANVTVALTALAIVLLINSGLAPIVDGLYVVQVIEELPAEAAGLQVGDIILRVDETIVLTNDEFSKILEEKQINDTVDIVIARGNKWKDHLTIPIKLAKHEGRLVIGVELSQLLIKKRMETYRTTPMIFFQLPTLGLSRNLIPFSDILHEFYAHPLGESWHVLANMFFWIWLININIAMFNSVPIYPLDGGRVFKNLLESMIGRLVKKKTISRITITVTIIVLSVIITTIIIPYLLF
jgi:membrane-associated protease RseP (regulator of RpoE activity)